MPEQSCGHLSRAVEGVTPADEGCTECLDSGGEWVRPRMCMTFGHVGCSDSSDGKHATRHFVETGHPAVQSFEPGETWGSYYEHERYLGPFKAVR